MINTSSEKPREGPGVDSRLHEDPERISLLAVLNLLLRHRKTLVFTPIAVILLGVLSTLLIGRNAAAFSSIVPQASGASASRLGGLAAQMGFALPMGDQAESPAFYAKLLKTRELLGEAVLTEYEIEGSGSGRTEAINGNLIELYGITGDTPEDQLKKAVKRLTKAISVTVDRETSVITLVTRSRRPALAIQINNRLLDLLNSYNLERRQSTAAYERTFISGRLSEAQQELLEAETDLEAFLEQNRAYRSPQLTFDEARLKRTVDLRYQVFSTLAQANEQARIEEVRNTPLITILERPEGSTEPTPRLILILLVSGVLGCVIGVAIVAAKEYMIWRRAVAPTEYRDFQNNLRTSLSPAVLRRRRVPAETESR